MEILAGVHLVDKVGMPGPGGPNPVNVGLLVEDGKVTLVDAGPPGVLAHLSACLEGIGLSLGAVRRVVITHHHIDHTGGLAEVVAASGAEVWAHRDDAGFIDGSVARPVTVLPEDRIRAFLPDATPEQVEGFKKQMAQFMRAAPVPVDLRLTGGEELAVLGGCRFLHTPGHTPGHLCLFLPARSLLIAGDLLRYMNGSLFGPPPEFTENPEEAQRSLRHLAGLSFEHVYGYHGEYLAHDAGPLARELAGN